MTWTLADAAILSTRDEFASVVVYQPSAGGGPYTVNAILDRPFEAVDLGGSDVMIAGRRPVLDLRLADLPTTPIPGDEMTIAGDAYIVEEVEPDGRGSAKLILSNGG